MKNNILLSTLLGGALLAACTADDVLDSVKTAQSVNPDAPVFTVHFEDNDGTRAEFLGDADYGKIRFKEGDLMSLFYGSSDYNQASDYNFNDYKGNAIYEGQGTGEGFQLKTRALVEAGGAIMVYPADTAFLNMGQTNPVIDFSKIIPNQNSKTKELTPYMSEVINILARPTEEGKADDHHHEAGYGRNYDVYLKRIGGTLQITPTPTNDDKLKKLQEGEDAIAALAFREVEIEVEGTSKNVFTTKVEIKSSGETSYAKNLNSNSPYYHNYWMNATVANATEATNDIKLTLGKDDDNVAIFTLLPLKSDVAGLGTDIDADKEEVTSAKGNTARFVKDVTGISDATVTVHTNYGKVEVKNASGNVWYRTGRQDEAETTVTGLAFALKHLFDAETSANSNVFIGEQVGWVARRVIEVDMSKLNMDNLHIETEKNLIDAVKVLKLMDKKDVTFILDGDKEKKNAVGENTDTDFLIQTEKGRTAYAEALGLGAKFALCNKKGEVCETVVLKNNETAIDVPSCLEFVLEAGEGESVQENPVAVRLEGNWKMTTSKRYKNVNEVKVAETANLALEAASGSEVTLGALKADRTELIDAPVTGDLPVLVNEGNINVNSVVFLKLNTANYGTIRIGDANHTGVDYTLKMEGYDNGNVTTITLGNMIDWVNKSNTTYDYENDAKFVKRGVIENYGQLAAAMESNGEINNYGRIIMKTASAVTLITNNGTNNTVVGATMLKALNPDSGNKLNKYTLGSDANVAGIIELYGKGNDLTKVNGKEGFIQQTITEKNVEGDVVSPWANYIVLAGEVTGVGDDVVTLKDLGGNEGNIRFVEMKSAMVRVEYSKPIHSSTWSWAAFVVRKGASVNIPKGVTVTNAMSYYKGQVYLAGSMTTGEYGQTAGKSTYFGGLAEDRRNVSVTGGEMK